MKDKLGGEIIAEFAVLRAKTYSYLINYSDENKKSKGTKKCAIKQKLKFKDYKACLEATQIENEVN